MRKADNYDLTVPITHCPRCGHRESVYQKLYYEEGFKVLNSTYFTICDHCPYGLKLTCGVPQYNLDSVFEWVKVS